MEVDSYCKLSKMPTLTQICDDIKIYIKTLKYIKIYQIDILKIYVCIYYKISFKNYFKKINISNLHFTLYLK